MEKEPGRWLTQHSRGEASLVHLVPGETKLHSETLSQKLKDRRRCRCVQSCHICFQLVDLALSWTGKQIKEKMNEPKIWGVSKVLLVQRLTLISEQERKWVLGHELVTHRAAEQPWRHLSYLSAVPGMIQQHSLPFRLFFFLNDTGPAIT